MFRKMLCILVVITIMTTMIPANAITIQSEIMPGATLMADPTEPVAPTEPTVNKTGNQTIDVGIPVEEHPELFITRSIPTHGDAGIAVFLIEFPDYKNEDPAATREYYDDLYFGDGIEVFWDGVVTDITVSEFFQQQSYGKLNMRGQVFDWYTAKHERSYYNNRKAELVMEAAEYYIAKGVDFSQFDGDDDGVIDGIVYHFAGQYSNVRSDSWYHGLEYSGGTSGYGKIDGLKFTTMVQVHQSFGLSTICHELMHALGMPDLYGEVYSSMDPTHDLMTDSHSVINPYTKMMLGWIDTVQVISEDTENVRLDVFEDSGEAAIVTDAFDGLFAEFYLVAYRKIGNNASAVVWHIDARLTDDGKSFRYDNYSYDPRPDKENPHGTNAAYTSEYLFIQEISADPDVDFVFEHVQVSDDRTAFKEDSVLGPGMLPSSDTHDGRSTGIRMEKFVEHNETYLTLDVSFVKDTNSPVITTKEDKLEFKKTITISFDENICPGYSWNNIQVVDLSGNPLEISVMQPHYPRNIIEITFADDAYQKGYQIIFPRGSVRDSSGKVLYEITLTAKADGYLFPVDQKLIPKVDGLKRNAGIPFFFPGEDSLVVISNGVFDTKIEFLRVDYNGNVLSQNVIDNPFVGSSIAYVKEMGDGSYIFVCREDAYTVYYNLLFCIDGNGDLRWTNDEYHDEQISFWGFNSFKYDTGIVIQFQKTDGRQKAVYINAQNGDVQDFETPFHANLFLSGVFDLGNGKLLRKSTDLFDSSEPTTLDIVDLQTFQVIASGQLTTEPGVNCYISEVITNANGTMILYCRKGSNQEAYLVDENLNILKSVVIKPYDYASPLLGYMGHNGFCDLERLSQGNHDNDQYHVRRYDQNLNLLWESDVEANYIYYFTSPDGDVLALTSKYVESTIANHEESYVEFYGSEPSAHSITSDAYTVSQLYISNIAIGTTAEQLLAGLEEAEYITIARNGEVVSGSTVIGTGMTVQLVQNDRVKVQYLIIVTGDTNGDGKISVTDFVQMQAHLLNKTPLQAAAAKAADTSGDGKISVTDYVQLQAHILGKSTVQPRSV